MTDIDTSTTEGRIVAALMLDMLGRRLLNGVGDETKNEIVREWTELVAKELMK